MFYDFKIEVKYMDILESININSELLLKEAGIPPRAVNNDKYQLTKAQYKKVLEMFDKHVNLSDLVALSSIESVATFVPEFFAGLCADNGLNCINRIAKYKALVAPVNMTIEQHSDSTSISYKYDDDDKLPRALMMNAQINILSIIRQGTGDDTISPISIMTEYSYPDNSISYIGTIPKLSTENKITYSNDDLKKPFITENNRMWDYLEPELNGRLEKKDANVDFSTQVRKTLFELIPSGISDMEKVSYELGMSKRTLGRRLSEEGTTYKDQLNKAREMLVCHYLKTDIPLNQIAFLVNYTDTKSLSRAFKLWTGVSISQYRKEYTNK